MQNTDVPLAFCESISNKYKNDGTIDEIYLAGYNAGSSSVKNYGCPIGATRINHKTGNVVYN